MSGNYRSWSIALIAGLGALALPGCGDLGSAQASADTSSHRRSPTMNAQPSAKADNFSRSLAIIRMILDDVETHFDGEAGGGVTRVNSEATNTFTVSLAKEGRTVSYTYEIEDGPDGKPRIKSKTESVKSYGS